MRIVIDTNVLLSGLLWHGAPHALFAKVRAEEVALITSPVLLDELAEVIARPKFATILRRTTRTPQQILHELQALAEVISPPPLPQPVCRDADDDAVLACAWAAQADLMVSGDADLLTLGIFEGMPIVTPAVALQLIETRLR